MRQSSNEKATQELQRTCLTAFGKLGDKATQEIGAKSLSDLVSILNNEAQVDVLLPLLYKTGEDQKPFARKVAVDLLGWLYHPSCATWEILMHPKHLNKAIAYIKARMMDSDRSAGDACVQTLGIMLERSMHTHLVPWTQEAGNCILRFLFAMMAERQAVQAVACKALKQAAEVLQYLPQGMWTVLLSHLSSSSYTARASIAESIASCSTHQEVQGLIMMPEDSVLPYLTAILGSGSLGLISCLRSPDWQTRRSAVNAIRAVLLVLGKALTEDQIAAVYQAVFSVKYDVAKNVRSATAECLPVLMKLMGGEVKTLGRVTPSLTPRSRRSSWTGSHGQDSNLPSPSNGTDRAQTPREAMMLKFRQSATKLDSVFLPREGSPQDTHKDQGYENRWAAATLPASVTPQGQEGLKDSPVGDFSSSSTRSKAATPKLSTRKPLPPRSRAQGSFRKDGAFAPVGGLLTPEGQTPPFSNTTRQRKSCGFTIMWDSLPDTDGPAAANEADSYNDQPENLLDRNSGEAEQTPAEILKTLESQLAKPQASSSSCQPAPGAPLGESQSSPNTDDEPDFEKLQSQMEQQLDQREKNQHFERALEDMEVDMQSAVALLSARLARLERNIFLPVLTDEDIAESPALKAGLPVRDHDLSPIATAEKHTSRLACSSTGTPQKCLF